MLEDYEQDPSSIRATNLVADLNTLKANISGETYNATQELTTGNGLFAGEEYDYDETSLLVLTANLIPYINGYDSDNKTYNRNADTFGYKEYPSSSLLLADRHLDESYTGNWNGLEPATYKELVMGASIISFMLLTTFDTSAIDPDRPNLKEIIEASRGNLVVDGGITLSTLVSTLRGEKDEKEDKGGSTTVNQVRSFGNDYTPDLSMLEGFKPNTVPPRAAGESPLAPRTMERSDDPRYLEKFEIYKAAETASKYKGGLEADKRNTILDDLIKAYYEEKD